VLSGRKNSKASRRRRYHLADHVYGARFKEEFLLLDTKKDRYIVCSQNFSGVLLELLGAVDSKDSFISPSSWDSVYERDVVSKLLDEGIVESREEPYPYHIDQKGNSGGVSNVDWRLPLDNKNIRLDSSVLGALFTLFKVNFYMNIKGFYPAIQLIKKAKNPKFSYAVPQTEDLENLARVVNKACLIYPTRTKCLEWSMVFVLLALKRRWKCNLEIGVQNYPFMAHAWVECDEKVVMDLQNLKEGLSVILREPFRKLR
jgi:hypothetical protein